MDFLRSETLQALLAESIGFSLCRERGLPIAPVSLGPIDFNANGMIDEGTVDLYPGSPAGSLKWFWPEID